MMNQILLKLGHFENFSRIKQNLKTQCTVLIQHQTTAIRTDPYNHLKAKKNYKSLYIMY